MNPLSHVAPWDLVAEGYAETTMKFFQGYTDAAVARAGLRREHRVLDVACGPGTLALTVAPRVRDVHAIDFAPRMLAILRAKMDAAGVSNIAPFCGDAQSLPYADQQFDAAFSMFGLMFFPSRDQGYAEIRRTLKPGGKILLSSWAPVAQSPLMQTVFGALRAINPAIPEPKTIIDSLENPEFFQRELLTAGFSDVTVHKVTQRLQYASLAQFWDDTVRGNAPITMLKQQSSEAQWQEKNRTAMEFLRDTVGDGPGALDADAWLAVGTR